jgi:hypothetical protein
LKCFLHKEQDVEYAGTTFTFKSDVLHEIDDGVGGRMAVMEWEDIESGFGPGKDHRLDKAEFEKLLELMRFRNISVVSLGVDFYGITAE